MDSHEVPDLAPDPHLMDYLAMVARHKWVVMFLIILCGAVGLGSTYYVPYTFEAQSLILPPDRGSSADLLSRLDAVGALKMIKAVENPSVDLLQNILSSREVAADVAQDSEIASYLRPLTGGGDAAIDAVHDAIEVLPGYSKIVVKGTLFTSWNSTGAEKERARVLSARVANLAVLAMDDWLRNEFRVSSHQRALYADSEYRAAQSRLDSLEDAKQAFEQKNGVVVLKQQLGDAVSTMGALTAQRDEARMKLDLLSRDLSTTSLDRTQAAAELTAAQTALDAFRSRSDFGPSVAELPVVEKQAAEFTRREATLTPVVTFLYEEVEQARINEQRARSVIQVLDKALPPDRKSSPKRLATLLLGLTVGFALSMSYIAMRSFMEDQRSRKRMREIRLVATSELIERG